MSFPVTYTKATETAPKMLKTKVTNTTVIIGDKGWELKGITPTDIAELHTELGTVQSSTNTDYQQVVTALSNILLNYNSPSFLDIPEGQDPETYLSKLKDALSHGIDTLDSGQKKVLENLQNIPGLGGYFKTAEDTATAVGEIIGFFKDVAVGTGKGVMLPFNIKGAAGEALAESGKYLDGKLNPITQEQAHALATVYAASLYKAKDAPYAPSVNKPRKPGAVDQVVAFTESAGDHIWGFVRTAWEFINSGISTGKWDWKKAASTVEADRGKTLSRKEYLNKNLSHETEEQTRASASQTLSYVEEVAGAPTKNLSGLIGKTGLYLDNNGQLNLLSFDEKGVPKHTQLKGTDGKSVSAAANQPHIQNITPENDIQLGAEALAAVNLVHGLSRGVMSKLVGKESIAAKNLEKLMKPVVELNEEAAKVRAGYETKDVFGKVTQHKPNKKLANKLEKEAAAEYKKIATEVQELKSILQTRTDLFGKTLTKFADSKPLMSHIHPNLGKLDLINRGGAAAGKAGGWAIDKSLEKLASGNLYKAKLAYAYDAVHGGFALIRGHTHEAMVDAGHIGGAWAASKYGAQLTDKMLTKYALKMAPGKSKLLVGGASLLSFLPGRKLGGAAVDATLSHLPGSENTQISAELRAKLEEKQVAFNTRYDSLQAMGVKPELVQTEDQISVLHHLPNDPTIQAQLLAQLQEAGIIPSTLSVAKQQEALEGLRELAHIKTEAETLLTRGPQATASDAAIEIATNIATGSNPALNAAGDVIGAIDAADDGNTRNLIRYGTRAATGVAGSAVTLGAFSAIMAGAGTGLAAGAVTGPGMIVTALAGAAAAAVGYYCYADTGEKIADMAVSAYDASKQKQLRKTAFSGKDASPTASQPDAALANAAANQHQKAQSAWDKAAMEGLKMSVVQKVQMGAVDSTGSSVTPTARTNQPAVQPIAFS